MRSFFHPKFILLSFLLFACNSLLIAQTTTPATSGADTMRIIDIIQGKSLRENTIDSNNVIETIAGNVILKEGNTIFNCDSAVLYKQTNIMEAFGNIHINQNDSINTYSQYLRYITNDRMAFLQKDVKLTDKKGTLYTQALQYDLKSNIGTYSNGGKVINGQTVLTSNDGTYYADTKDVYFKNNVHLVDPKYDIVTYSLLYNTQTQLTTFITQTYIKSKNGGDIYTSQGTYDLQNGKAFFGKRSIIKDSSRIYVSDNSAYDEKSGIAQLEGNAVIKDSANGYTILGNQIYLDKKTNSFLATRKPVLIFKSEDNDITFIAADKLFSGVAKKDTIRTDTTFKTDTLIKIITIKSSDTLPAATEKQDSVRRDTTFKKDTLINKVIVKASSDTLVRYFQAFHNVRIYNDSLQAVCDSLFYTTADSVFRLFKQPLLFANRSQISGDTIFLYTKNKKAERLYVFNNCMIINNPDEQLYNQISGRTINGYFKNGQLDYMHVRGFPAQSVYYPQNDDSAYIGMNRSKGDVIDIYFFNKELHKVKFTNDVDGILYPMLQIPADQKFLTGFKWLDSRRPKNKLELFE